MAATVGSLEYATLSSREGISSEEEAGSIYGDATLTDADRELIQMQEHLDSRVAPPADSGQAGAAGWDITAANRYLGLHDRWPYRCNPYGESLLQL